MNKLIDVITGNTNREKLDFLFFTFLLQGCDLIPDGGDEYTYISDTTLMIINVKNEHRGIYTCTLTFTLDGVTGSVSESIEATIEGWSNSFSTL